MIGETARTKISTLVPVLVALALASFASVLFLDFADAVFGILLAAAALFVAVIDIDRFEIPDIASLAIFALGLALTQVSGIDIPALAQCVLRSVLVAALLFVLRAAYRWVRGLEGRGQFVEDDDRDRRKIFLTSSLRFWPPPAFYAIRFRIGTAVGNFPDREQRRRSTETSWRIRSSQQRPL
jgi:prepilin signal peptidase PulO-like enzyme (type II secretory pathway)